MRNFNPAMQKANFTDANVEIVQVGRISRRIAQLDGLSATMVRFPKGASLLEDAVGTGLRDSLLCMRPHVAYVLEGALGVRQSDGSEEVFNAGDIMLLPPGHDAWTVGDEDCVFIEFSRGGDDYYA